MITMHELVDLRMQQHIAHEIYRQQIMQRIPDPFPPLMPLAALQPPLMMPTHPPLPDVEAKLENDDLWQQFHKIGTEMIITKTGRRMFPSPRLSLSGLEDESSYCVLLEMVPIGDCRYKFSGSQWVPAGGAEPQSPQRMYLHPDSPASGAHWQAQPILFNKVKLTNNTLDSNGHIVLASMHKYQPRIHVIRTADLTQIPWAPQQAFVFPETEFVAVTAYQNDRITKLKIDNNPFAKGFRETGQSRCKRKMSSSPTLIDDNNQQSQQARDNATDDDHVSVSSQESQPLVKRMRSNGSAASSVSLLDDSFSMPPRAAGNHLMGGGGGGAPSFMDFAAHAAYYQQHGAPGCGPMPSHLPHLPNLGPQLSAAHLLQSHIGYLRPDLFAQAQEVYQRSSPRHHQTAFHDEADSRSSSAHTKLYDGESDEDHEPAGCDDEFVDVVSTATELEQPSAAQPSSPQRPQSGGGPGPQQDHHQQQHTSPAATKSKCFSISSILGGNKEV